VVASAARAQSHQASVRVGSPCGSFVSDAAYDAAGCHDAQTLTRVSSGLVVRGKRIGGEDWVT